jgi:chaperone required for assembly of F1-ATPase
MQEVKAEIVKFAGSDLICYRADSPDTLVELENTHWNVVFDYFKTMHHAPFILATGISYVKQPASSTAIIESLLPQDPFKLGAIHVITTLTGSSLLAIALSLGVLKPQQAWLAAHVDEDFQITEWGDDDEAIERRAARFNDFQAAVSLL